VTKILLYAPMLYHYDRGWGPPTCPDTWYFEWQWDLHNFFLERKDLGVIWKAPPRGSALQCPIRHLHNNRIFENSNIFYTTGKLTKWLKRADMVFVDYPSTPMFEAWDMGLPVLCITPSWDVNEIRPHLFSQLCLYCIEPNEAYRKIVFSMIDEWIKNPEIKSEVEGVQCPV